MVAVNIFVQNDMIHKNECSLLIEKLKFIQQRFLNIQVFGIQYAFISTCLQNAASKYDYFEGIYYISCSPVFEGF
jgi:hypothetical protein